MAEGFARELKGREIEAYSAGIETHGLNPHAVRVMAEAGVDISDSAAESCPVFPGNARIVHRSFDDPPRLAANARSEEEGLEHYRRVRDEIRSYVASLPQTL
jgi:arsenate reductase